MNVASWPPAFWGAACIALAGCRGPNVELPPMPPPVVTVAKPLQRDVVDTAEFTGRTTAVESVKVRARVWGYLQKISFTEGAEVKKGDLLYVIDPRPYQAALARAEADFAQSEAKSSRVSSDFGRAQTLSQTRSISREEFEKVSFEYAEAKAAARSTQAAVETAKLNLEYTEVRAPISGQIGKTMVTAGNLIESGELGGTLLTTIVSVSPMHAYFDVDDQTYVQIKKLLTPASSGSVSLLKIRMGLAGETDYPHEGDVDFIDNQIDPGTGTLRMRAVFKNADRRLTPGLFARVQVPLGGPHKAILVTERAIETDQGQKVLYVVNKDKVVEKRLVKLGRLHDGLREIEEGVKLGDQVIVEGLQRVRPGIPVDPKELPEMPVFRSGQRQETAPKADASQPAKS